MIKIRNVQVIDVSDWDGLVEETYGRPYSFQQQDGCKDRQHISLTVPAEDAESHYDYKNDSVPDVVNGEEMGVSFAAWLARDPKEWNGDPEDEKPWIINLFWRRNFYPAVEMIANDLLAKGLIPAGEYEIDIDW